MIVRIQNVSIQVIIVVFKQHEYGEGYNNIAEKIGRVRKDGMGKMVPGKG